MLNTIEKVLGNMASKGLIFENEKDFQLQFATELQKELNQIEEGNTVLLECWALKSDKAACRTDIVIQTPKKEYIAIELKYKMTDKHCEKREFPKQEAQDLGKYDFLLDVSRNEQLLKGETVLGYKFIKGYAIILTNDHLYWHVAGSNKYQYENFRIDNREDENNDSLPVKVSVGVKRWKSERKSRPGRENPIPLTHNYTAYWKRYDYCKECNSCENIFKYLIFETK